MFQRIVVAYDGSEEANSSVRLAFALGQACGSTVTIVRVVDQPGALAVQGLVLVDLEERVSAADRQARRDVAELASQAPRRLAVATHVLHGPPAATLVEYLRESDADLIVMGTHGLGGLKTRLLGSVSQQVMEHARCSVLLVRRDLPSGDEVTVLAALDGSEASMVGLAAAQALAAALGATLCLFHAVDPHIPFAPIQPTREMLEQMRRAGEEVLHEGRATVSAPLEQVTEDLRLLSPREALLAACEEHMPAIAVVGSRGIGGFRGLLVGSTARELVDHAPCPVLVTRPAPADEVQ